MCQPLKAGFIWPLCLTSFSRTVIGWAMAAGMTTQLVERALRAALKTRRLALGLLHHSDRGSQYASHAYRAWLHAWNAQISMSLTGVCYDNAVIGSFFATLKAERIHEQHYHSCSEARQDIFHYIETFYNRRRRHSALDFLAEDEFERRHHGTLI